MDYTRRRKTRIGFALAPTHAKYRRADPVQSANVVPGVRHADSIRGKKEKKDRSVPRTARTNRKHGHRSRFLSYDKRLRVKRRRGSMNDTYIFARAYARMRCRRRASFPGSGIRSCTSFIV